MTLKLLWCLQGFKFIINVSELIYIYYINKVYSNSKESTYWRQGAYKFPRCYRKQYEPTSKQNYKPHSESCLPLSLYWIRFPCMWFLAGNCDKSLRCVDVSDWVVKRGEMCWLCQLIWSVAFKDAVSFLYRAGVCFISLLKSKFSNNSAQWGGRMYQHCLIYAVFSKSLIYCTTT